MPAIVDVRDAPAVRAMVEDAHREHGRLDLMFNNAGAGIGGQVDGLSLEHWNRALDVNVRGVIHGVHAAYPLMLAQGFGHIVNTALATGLLPVPLLAPYSMSKHAVVGLSPSLRAEAADRGVKVSVVCPGVIETPILDKGNPHDLPPCSTRCRDASTSKGSTSPTRHLPSQPIFSAESGATELSSSRRGWHMCSGSSSVRPRS